jgi:hypothetical protein
MKFIKAAENFFYQLQFAIVIDPFPRILNGIYPVPGLIQMSRIKEQIEEYKLDYPFIAANKILELKILMKKDKISFNVAQDICSNFARVYWGEYYSMPIIFPEIKEDLLWVYSTLHPEATVEDLIDVFDDFCTIWIHYRDNIYEDLLLELADLPPRNEWDIKLSESTKKLQFFERIAKTAYLEDENTDVNSDKNAYPRIFTSSQSFKLFEYLHKQVSERTQLAEYSFIYRSMVKDGYIHENVRSTEFIDFLSKNYQVVLTEIKQYHNCNGGNKISKYTTAKLLFKP